MAPFTKQMRDPGRVQAIEVERLARTEAVNKKKEEAAKRKVDDAKLESKFAARPTGVEDLLKTDTVGLVTHEDFKKRREYLEKCAEEERERRKEDGRKVEAEERRRKLKRGRASKLSFAADESDDESDGGGDEDIPVVGTKLQNGRMQSEIENIALKRRRLGKNPDVDSSFLPDRDREREMAAERARLKQAWLNEQAKIKAETIRITYSYWDGTGHRRSISCTKGTTVGRFLAMVQGSFKELRNISADQLMFIKEDLIIPHHYTFYDFIITKARGKSGPLFDFGVKEDVRLVNDAGKEKEDAHAGKVVERRWYERNRHIFPASRWEVYDPKKSYDKYTIHGNEVL